MLDEAGCDAWMLNMGTTSYISSVDVALLAVRQSFRRGLMLLPTSVANISLAIVPIHYIRAELDLQTI